MTSDSKKPPYQVKTQSLVVMPVNSARQPSSAVMDHYDLPSTVFAPDQTERQTEILAASSHRLDEAS